MDPLIVFLQAVVSGVSIGCIYALVALGCVLIYKATEVVNFAQGELMMVGAFFAYSLVDLGGVSFIDSSNAFADATFLMLAHAATFAGRTSSLIKRLKVDFAGKADIHRSYPSARRTIMLVMRASSVTQRTINLLVWLEIYFGQGGLRNCPITLAYRTPGSVVIPTAFT